MGQEVVSGVRTARSWNGSRSQAPSDGQGGGENVPNNDWLPLARPDELGPWNAGGQRSWLLAEQGDECNGWFVLCSGGQLQTHTGTGTWQLDGMKRLVVHFADASYELQLHKNWGGVKRDNFISVACHTITQEQLGNVQPPYSVLTGWVAR